MKKALIDASSAILLFKANIFGTVAELYQLCMVPTVFDEITVAHRHGAEVFQTARDAGKIHLMAPARNPFEAVPAPGLHAGERETIRAYDGNGIHFIIMDDGRGTRACRDQKIPHINALLCPRILYMAGTIDGAVRHSAFEYLKEIGRYGDDVISYAASATRQSLAPFFP